MNVSKSIGSTIKLCRGQRGFSQGELAERAGLSVSYLSLIEQGKRTPNLEILEDITDALRIPLNILVFLASDKSELAELDKSAAEKLSLVALKLMEEDDERAVLQK
jgi:transcriptional regulator with XRE-family HTH domain